MKMPFEIAFVGRSFRVLKVLFCRAVFAANIHLDKTAPLGACFNSFHDKSTSDVAALSNRTGDGLVWTA